MCQCCGEPFQSIRPNAKFCKPACREKFYRQQKRAAKQEKDTPRWSQRWLIKSHKLTQRPAHLGRAAFAMPKYGGYEIEFI